MFTAKTFLVDNVRSKLQRNFSCDVNVKKQNNNYMDEKQGTFMVV